MPRWVLSFAERFWVRVNRSFGPKTCWPWLGRQVGRGSDRRGHLYIKGGAANPVYKYAPRVAWELTHGPIPPHLKVLHSCDNPICCNPAHLRLGTQKDNAL